MLPLLGRKMSAQKFAQIRSSFLFLLFSSSILHCVYSFHHLDTASTALVSEVVRAVLDKVLLSICEIFLYS